MVTVNNISQLFKDIFGFISTYIEHKLLINIAQMMALEHIHEFDWYKHNYAYIRSHYLEFVAYFVIFLINEISAMKFVNVGEFILMKYVLSKLVQYISAVDLIPIDIACIRMPVYKHNSGILFLNVSHVGDYV